MMNGVLRYIDERDSLSIRDFRYSVTDHCYEGDPPWKGNADGVILNAANSPGVVPWIERGNVPAISTAADLLGTSIPCVCVENASLAKLSAKHAAEAGFLRAVYVGKKDYETSLLRRDALASELGQRGIGLSTIDLESIPRVGYDQPEDEASFAAIRDLLMGLQERTLVICINDRAAAVVVRLAQQLKIDVPQQVGVLGVGDTDLAQISDPPISSVRIDREQIGYQAAENLHQLLQGIRLREMNCEVPVFELVVRPSTNRKAGKPVTDIDHAIAFIEGHAFESIRLQDIADAVQVPLRTLEIDFKKSTGRTMGDMIQQLRLDRARQLLETTDLSMQRIATLIGFTHYSTLSRMTVRMIGMTPSQYREQHRSNLK